MALNPNITKEHLAKTKVISSGGSPLSPQIIEKLKEKVHPDCELKVKESNDCSRIIYGHYQEGYGMTECPLISRGKRGDNVKKSVGKLLPNMTARVVDPNGHNVGPNTPGELYIRCSSEKILKMAKKKYFFPQSSAPYEGLLQQ